MKPENFRYLFSQLNSRRPWRPFTLELVNGSRMEVNHPESVTLGKELLAVTSTFRSS